MKIKATINVEYNVDPEKYHYLDPDNREQCVQAIEHHLLREAIFEIMPFTLTDDQVLKIKLEE